MAKKTHSELLQQEETIRQLYVELQMSQSKLHNEKQQREELEADLERVYGSMSWRIARSIQRVREVFWSTPAKASNSIASFGRSTLRASSQKQRKLSGSKISKGKEARNTKVRSRRKSKLEEYDPVVGTITGKRLALYHLNQFQSGWDDASRLRLKSLGNELGEYDPRNPAVIRFHIEQAKSLGLDGFCYVFDSQSMNTFQDGPMASHRDDPNLDFHYCFAWDQSVDSLLGSNFEFSGASQFIEYVSSFVDDPRFVRVRGRPLIVCRSSEASVQNVVVSTWENWARDARENFELRFWDPNQDDGLCNLVAPDSNRDSDVYGLSVRSDRNVFQYDCDKIGIEPFQTLIFDAWNDWSSDKCMESKLFQEVDLGGKSYRRLSNYLSDSQEKILLLCRDEDLSIYCALAEKYQAYDIMVLGLEECFPRKFEPRTFSVWKYFLKKMERRGFQALMTAGKDSSLENAAGQCGWRFALLDPEEIETEVAMDNAIVIIDEASAGVSIVLKQKVIQKLVTKKPPIDRSKIPFEMIVHSSGSIDEVLSKPQNIVGIWDKVPSVRQIRLGYEALRDPSLVAVAFTVETHDVYGLGTRLSQEDWTGTQFEELNILGAMSNCLIRKSALGALLEDCEFDELCASPFTAWLGWWRLLQRGEVLIAGFGDGMAISHGCMDERLLSLFLKNQRGNSFGHLEQIRNLNEAPDFRIPMKVEATIDKIRQVLGAPSNKGRLRDFTNIKNFSSDDAW